jgi:cytochrome c oxidase subunit II
MSRRRPRPRMAEQARLARERRARRIRQVAFAVVALVVLGGGVLLAGADLTGPRDQPTSAGAITVRASMAGFTPSVISAQVGETVTIEFWTTDSAPHLVGGVHTFISDELGIYQELPAESRHTFSFVAPQDPGDYDIYCDTCCGGRQSPSMHGILRIEA